MDNLGKRELTWLKFLRKEILLLLLSLFIKWALNCVPIKKVFLIVLLIKPYPIAWGRHRHPSLIDAFCSRLTKSSRRTKLLLLAYVVSRLLIKVVRSVQVVALASWASMRSEHLSRAAQTKSKCSRVGLPCLLSRVSFRQSQCKPKRLLSIVHPSSSRSHVFESSEDVPLPPKPSWF